MFKRVLAASALLLAAAGPSSAQYPHQQDCSPRAALLKLLADKYREAPVASGIANNGHLVEVTSKPGGASWTIIVTSPKGIACLVAAGEGWRARPGIEWGQAL